MTNTIPTKGNIRPKSCIGLTRRTNSQSAAAINEGKNNLGEVLESISKIARKKSIQAHDSSSTWTVAIEPTFFTREIEERHYYRHTIYVTPASAHSIYHQDAVFTAPLKPESRPARKAVTRFGKIPQQTLIPIPFPDSAK